MNLLDWINQGITNLVNTSSPSIDALGFRMFVSLLTIMMVWLGVQEALSSAEGRSGFSIAKFVEFVVIASFAYTLIEFYDSTIPGVGYSFKDFITIGANSLANMIGQDSVNQLNQTITGMQNQLGSGILKAIMNEYYAIVMVLVQVLLGVFSATIAAIRSEEHTSELQSRLHLVCRLLLEKKKGTHCAVPASSSGSAPRGSW